MKWGHKTLVVIFSFFILLYILIYELQYFDIYADNINLNNPRIEMTTYEGNLVDIPVDVNVVVAVDMDVPVDMLVDMDVDMDAGVVVSLPEAQSSWKGGTWLFVGEKDDPHPMLALIQPKAAVFLA